MKRRNLSIYSTTCPKKQHQQSSYAFCCFFFFFFFFHLSTSMEEKSLLIIMMITGTRKQLKVSIFHLKTQFKKQSRFYWREKAEQVEDVVLKRENLYKRQKEKGNWKMKKELKKNTNMPAVQVGGVCVCLKIPPPLPRLPQVVQVELVGRREKRESVVDILSKFQLSPHFLLF